MVCVLLGFFNSDSSLRKGMKVIQQNIDTTYLKRCIAALDKAFSKLQGSKSDEIEYEIYRSAVIKEFEIILEQSGKL